jgi:hypothetical protein
MVRLSGFVGNIPEAYFDKQYVSTSLKNTWKRKSNEQPSQLRKYSRSQTARKGISLPANKDGTLYIISDTF